MNDLLVPGIRIKPREVSPPPPILKKPKPPQKRTQQSQSFAVDAISRTIRGTGSFLLSLSDGLTEVQREYKRRLEERKQILCLRMKNVGILP
jgi:TAG lipase / steryl ester hydrolase / phospholipase A2 / LPA acyltransferase